MTDNTDLDFAWFVGVFEGEGCITLERQRPTLRIAMADEDIIRRVHAIAGVGYVFVSIRDKNPLHKPMWSWGTSRQGQSINLLWRMLPLLGERRAARAWEVLEVWAAKEHRLANRPTRHHGTRARYRSGCTCDECRGANTRYERERRAKLHVV